MCAKPKLLVSRPLDLSVNDCACPDGGLEPPPRPKHNIVTHSPTHWQIATALHRASLPDEHELVFNPLGFSNVIVLNASASVILNSFVRPHALDAALIPIDLPAEDIQSTLDQLADLELITPVGYLPQLTRSQPHTLTAWLHVTNACNLSCHYCYVDKTDDEMSETTGLAAVEAVFRSALKHGFKSVKLKYAGGEATLNFPLVVKLHQHATQLAQQIGLDLHEVVLSNGVALSRAMLDSMREYGMHLMISLDGVGETHDQQRSFANGRGSFTLVARGIDNAIKYGVQPHLSITATGRSASKLADAVNFALDRDLRFNLNFYRDNECSASIDDLKNDQAQLISGMQSAFAAIEARLPQQRLIDGMIDHSAFNEPHEYSCGAGHNYMVVKHDGDIARCQMQLERPITHVLADDPLLALRSHKQDFQNISVNEKSGCRDCTWKLWCAGGCSLLTFKATGRSDVQSPYCNVYKALYPSALRLEGLRLMRWQN